MSQLEGVLAAAPLDEAMVGHVLDGLEGLGLSGQALSGQALEAAGAPHTAHVPGVPAHLHRLPTRLPSFQPFTLSRPRTDACKLVNKLRKKQGESAPLKALKAHAAELYTQWSSDGGAD